METVLSETNLYGDSGAIQDKASAYLRICHRQFDCTQYALKLESCIDKA